MPGLSDMHVHATLPQGRDALGHSMPLYLSYGIVRVRDMGAKLDALAALKGGLAANAGLPDLVAAGPVLDGPKRPWQQQVALPLADAAAVPQAVRKLAGAGVDFLKPYDGLSPEQYAALAAAAREAGLPLAGHVPLGMTVEQVSAAGQKSIEHAGLQLAADCMPDGQKAMPAMLNAWISRGYKGKFEESLSWWSRRDPAACAALYSRLARRGTWVTPTLGFEIKDQRWVTADELADLTPELLKSCESDLSSIAAPDQEAREAHYKNVFEQVRDLHQAGVPLLAGSDVPNTCQSHGRSLHRELRLLRHAGLSNWEALKTATLNPARYLGRNDEGAVRKGAVANLLLLNADPLADITNTLKIGGVMLRGAWHDPDDLARLRARSRHSENSSTSAYPPAAPPPTLPH
jgi:hypothetical protein